MSVAASKHPPAPTPLAAVRGYTASKDQLLARLRRIDGQVRGIERMVVDDRMAAVGRLVKRR